MRWRGSAGLKPTAAYDAQFVRPACTRPDAPQMPPECPRPSVRIAPELPWTAPGCSRLAPAAPDLLPEWSSTAPEEHRKCCRLLLTALDCSQQNRLLPTAPNNSRLLTAARSCSRLLPALPGPSVLLPAAAGCCRLLPAAPGCSRLLPAAPGCSRLLPAAHGSSPLLRAAPGCTRPNSP